MLHNHHKKEITQRESSDMFKTNSSDMFAMPFLPPKEKKKLHLLVLHPSQKKKNSEPTYSQKRKYLRLLNSHWLMKISSSHFVQLHFWHCLITWAETVGHREERERERESIYACASTSVPCLDLINLGPSK